jgi:hypothetical protein
MGERGSSAGDAVLQRLAYHHQYIALERRQLVQEEDAVVRQAHLAGARGQAADEAGVGDFSEAAHARGAPRSVVR